MMKNHNDSGEQPNPPVNTESTTTYLPSGDTLVKGLITGVIVSTVTQSGRRLIRTIAKSPVTLFGMGLVAGYFLHKHRKKIGLEAKAELTDASPEPSDRRDPA